MTPADAVRVWRGFRSPSMQVGEFITHLGEVFIPATVLMQVPAGLNAYIPTVLAGLPDKPDTVPDETAIVFWDSQDTYTDAFQTLAVRSYTLLHRAVFTPDSHTGFPVPFAGNLVTNQPYHLTADPSDWMHSQVHHVVGARPGTQTPEEFSSQLALALAGFGQMGLAAAIACACDNYIVYWELHAGAAGGPSALIDRLSGLAGWSHIATPAPTIIDHGLWDRWPGPQAAPGASLNAQFRRRWESS